MTRLQSLIKEVLSQPKKKDCNCGCNDCGGKAPILTEGKIKHLISEVYNTTWIKKSNYTNQCTE